MKIYVKKGQLFISKTDDLDRIEIRSDNEISFLDINPRSLPYDKLELTAFDNIPDVIEGVDTIPKL